MVDRDLWSGLVALWVPNSGRPSGRNSRPPFAGGVSRWTAYRWRQDDLEFPDQWDEAIENAVDAVENVIYQRALGGDVIAAIFYLKAQRSKFRDRLNINVEQLHSEIEEAIERIRKNPDLLLARPVLEISRGRSAAPIGGPTE